MDMLSYVENILTKNSNRHTLCSFVLQESSHMAVSSKPASLSCALYSSVVSPSMSWLRMDSDGLNSAGQSADRFGRCEGRVALTSSRHLTPATVSHCHLGLGSSQLGATELDFQIQVWTHMQYFCCMKLQTVQQQQQRVPQLKCQCGGACGRNVQCPPEARVFEYLASSCQQAPGSCRVPGHQPHSVNTLAKCHLAFCPWETKYYFFKKKS